MSVKRTVIFGVVGGAIAVWLAAAATSTPRTVAPIAPPKATAVDRSGAELAAEIARLHERLRPGDTPLQSRNLFRYSSPALARRSEAAAPSAPIVREQPAAAVAATISPLKLVGIAEDTGDAGTTRTAIISGFGELFLVKEGDAVTLRYRVSRVAPDAVELVDVGDNTPLRLVLR
jgi:hypothetical protein